MKKRNVKGNSGIPKKRNLKPQAQDNILKIQFANYILLFIFYICLLKKNYEFPHLEDKVDLKGVANVRIVLQ